MTRTQKYSRIGWLICTLGALFYCYEYFLRIMPSVMTNDLMRAFHIDASLLGNLAAFYYYAYTPMQIPVGVMIDRYGPKRLIVFAIQVCGLGVLLFGTPGHLYVSYLGRFLVGFGSAFAFVGVLKLATEWLPIRFFGFISGATTSLGMLGGMFGSIYLEKIVSFSGWEATIKISAIAAFILGLFISLIMPEQSGDLAKKQAPLTYKELAINLWQLIKYPIIWLNGLVGCLLYMSLSVFAELWGPKYLQITHQLSSAHAVQACSVMFLAWTVGGPIIGMFAKDYRRSLWLLMGGSLIAAAFSGLLLLKHDLSLPATEIVLFIYGVGTSAEILVFNIACMSVNRKFAATAIAFTNMLVMLGGSIFEPLVGKFLDLSWHGQFVAGIKDYSALSFNNTLLVLPLGALLSFFTILLMWRYASSYKVHEGE